MRITEIKTLEGGLEFTTESHDMFMFCTEDLGDTWYKVNLYNGTAWYTVIYVSMDKTTDYGAILDKVADFIEENEFKNLYCDYYEAQDNDLVTESGDVMDMVCVGNHGIYISNQFIIEEVQHV